MLDVLADVVIYDSPLTQPVDSKEPFLVPQSHSITFVNNQSFETQGLSGNPGYIDGLPLLVAQNDVDTGAKNLYQNGYEVRGGDQ